MKLQRVLYESTEQTIRAKRFEFDPRDPFENPKHLVIKTDIVLSTCNDRLN